MKIVLNEEEKNQISSQHEEIDSRIFNFLMRRIKKEKRKLGSDWDDFKPIEVTEYTFEGLPGFGFNSFYSSKKNIEKRISHLLYSPLMTTFLPGKPEIKDIL